MMQDESIEFQFPEVKDQTQHIIKVIGVGGGGGNAVENMYRQGVHNVSFAVCNTDSQALNANEVPIKIQLGDGLGAGGDPEKGREAAEKTIDSVQRLLGDQTQMVFITAAMGGGTGTGAAPIIAKACKEKGILTIGVVTIPFRFELNKKIYKALAGVERMKKCVDALLVINNERIRDIYSDYSTEQAFKKADEILAVATRSIAEIITKKGIVNRDFCDVKAVMENGGAAIMAEGMASGEHRVEKAMMNALNSPLLNCNDIRTAKRLLYVIYQSESSPLAVTELDYVTQFMNELQDEVDVNWGLYSDDSLGENIKVNIIATGFDEVEDAAAPSPEDDYAVLKEYYYGKGKSETAPEVTPVAPAEPTVPEEEEEDSEEEEKPSGNKLGRSWKTFMTNLQIFLEND